MIYTQSPLLRKLRHFYPRKYFYNFSMIPAILALDYLLMI